MTTKNQLREAIQKAKFPHATLQNTEHGAYFTRFSQFERLIRKIGAFYYIKGLKEGCSSNSSIYAGFDQQGWTDFEAELVDHGELTENLFTDD